jgi:putative transposase
MAKRKGSMAAHERFGAVGVSTLRPDFLTDILQIDHTLVDVIVVDQEHRLPIGPDWSALADACH